jgi:hypothetical protein
MKKNILFVSIIFCVILFFILGHYERYSKFRFLFIGLAFVFLIFKIIYFKNIKSDKLNLTLSKQQKKNTVIWSIILFALCFFCFFCFF